MTAQPGGPVQQGQAPWATAAPSMVPSGPLTITPSISSDPGGPHLIAGSPEANAAIQSGGATAKSAHEMIVATGIVIVVVYLLVIVAGMSKGAGRAVLAFFGMAIVIQGLGHTGSVLNFVNSKPLTRKAG